MPRILGPIRSKGGTAQHFDVRNYGALGTGSGDDGVAFQAALDAAVAAGGGTVFIPAGTYGIQTSPKILGSNITIKADPNATIKRMNNGVALLQNAKTDDTDANGGYTGNGNIIVDGGTWDMNGATYTTAQGTFGFGHAENIKVRNLTIKDVPQYHAIEFNACKNVLVENCRFLGYYWSASVPNGGSQTFAFEEAIQIDLAKSGFINISPYDLTVCQDVRIINNYFGASGTSGTIAWPTAFGSHTSVIGRPHTRILFQGNTVENAGYMGIRGYHWDNVQVIGNKFIGCDQGLKLCNVNTTETTNSVDDNGNVVTTAETLYNFTIQNNVFKNIAGTNPDSNNQAHGVTIIGYGTTRILKNVTISGNLFDTMTSHNSNNKAIHINTATNVQITGNTITDPAQQGIGVYNGNQVAITGNVLNLTGSTGGNGMHLDTNVDMVVSGNLVIDAWGYGVLFNACTNAVGVGNTVKNFGRQSSSAGYAAWLVQGSSNTAYIVNNTLMQGTSGTKYAVKSSGTTNLTATPNYSDVTKSSGNADANGNWIA